MPYFFIDSITAYHSTITVASDSSKRNTRDAEPFVRDMRCQLSFSGEDNASPKGQVTFPQQRGLNVYIHGIGYGFKSGDWVVIKRNGAVAYEGSIGEPKIYDRLIVHTELALNSYREVKSDGR